MKGVLFMGRARAPISLSLSLSIFLYFFLLALLFFLAPFELIIYFYSPIRVVINYVHGTTVETLIFGPRRDVAPTC